MLTLLRSRATVSRVAVTGLGSPMQRRNFTKASRKLPRACSSSRSPHKRAISCSRDHAEPDGSARQVRNARLFLPGGVTSRPSAVLNFNPPSRRRLKRGAIGDSICLAQSRMEIGADCTPLFTQAVTPANERTHGELTMPCFNEPAHGAYISSRRVTGNTAHSTRTRDKSSANGELPCSCCFSPSRPCRRRQSEMPSHSPMPRIAVPAASICCWCIGIAYTCF
jgi:hypothetical protein